MPINLFQKQEKRKSRDDQELKKASAAADPAEPEKSEKPEKTEQPEKSMEPEQTGVSEVPEKPENKDDGQKGTEPGDDFDDTIAVPPVEVPFCGLKNRIAYFGFSQRGQSHIESGAPCQDRCYSVFVPESGHLVMAIADGVGSCALSDLGARTAVQSVVHYIEIELKNRNQTGLDGQAAGPILRNAMQFAYDEVEKAAVNYEQLLYSLQSTLTVAIYDGSNLYFGHAGDDGIVALKEDGTLALATTRHKGDEASSVYPLQGKTTWQFGMVPNTVAFVMATDGVLDAFVKSSYENDRVYYPFIEPIFKERYRSERDVEKMCASFFDYMNSQAYRASVTDDLTLTVAMNLNRLPNCLPAFDVDAWNEETRKYDEQRRNALYGAPAADPARQSGAQQPVQGAAPQNPPQQPSSRPSWQQPVEPVIPPHHSGGYSGSGGYNAGGAPKRGFFDKIRNGISRILSFLRPGQQKQQSEPDWLMISFRVCVFLFLISLSFLALELFKLIRAFSLLIFN